MKFHLTFEIDTNLSLRVEISCQAQCESYTIVVRINDKRKIFQKRHLSIAIKEAYHISKKEHHEVFVGKAQFTELRPKYVLYSSDLPQNVCTCKYQDNI